jgi:hypothetical protein
MNDNSREKRCQECLFYEFHPRENRENCLRFARFVDHVITEYTKDCDYWTPNSPY